MEMELPRPAAGPAEAVAAQRDRSFWATNVAPVVMSKGNILLLAAPVALIFRITGWSSSVLFILALVALCPCAERLGFVTEQLAEHTNDTLGGLINATFGNITELVIAIFAIEKGLLRVVQLSLLGSVVSNLLLVLGTAFLVGGIVNPGIDEQSFNVQGVGVNSSLLMLAALGVLLPSTLGSTGTERVIGSSAINLSRAESIILLFTYGGLLIFQLRTHRHIFDGTHEGDAARSGSATPNRALLNGHVNSSCGRAAAEMWTAEADGMPAVTVDVPSHADPRHVSIAGSGAAIKPGEQEEAEDAESELSFWACIVWLSLLAVVIAFLSDWIVSTIEVAAEGLKVPLPFLTTIVLPIVGNAAEHFSAITFAARNRMELTMGVAVGSATQIAVLVLPLCILIGWMLGEPLSLDFMPFEAVALFTCILLTIITVQHATSNWLKGATLLAAYAFLCAGFWVHKDALLNTDAA